ncbi:RING-H2 finger protein ATL46 [Prunus yedoensis var. nudiflora]|uniref:RING-H2 finger protein ATL46 n=1 Tax=Prunus yedoensis var. nudiflora TaxID=2094558 RepID=A0A314ZLX0_PRUYE|nr:RING-H2 finger protein ATL46 [Prunus yedoensis var. nudiflora]
MGTYQYVVGDSNLQVALSHDCGGDSDAKLVKEGVHNGNFSVNGNLEGKKISGRHKGESFSVSKIWLWSSKNRFPVYVVYVSKSYVQQCPDQIKKMGIMI